MTPQPTYLSAEEINGRFRPRDAVAALRRTLMDGFDPSTDAPRTFTDVPNGQILTMPSAIPGHAGLKVLTMAPTNPDRGLDMIQGVYLLCDGETLAPTHMLDGVALTDLRTPAMSIAAVWDALIQTQEPVRAVIFGTGHQGLGHARTLRDALDGHRRVESITAIVRSPEKALADEDVRTTFDAVLGREGSDAAAALRAANVIICATSSPTPLFNSTLVANDAIVMAVGAHTTEARELDSALMRRSDIVVEDVETALAECGDVVIPMKEGLILVDELINVADFVTGRQKRRGGRPLVFKGSGMSWQDLVVAQAIATGGTPSNATSSDVS